MAYFGFINKLIKGETIQISNYGNCKRNYTYVDNIVETPTTVTAALMMWRTRSIPEICSEEIEIQGRGMR